METLKQMSMSVVVKLGMSRAELPLTLRNEIEIMEERIKSEWTGIFMNSSNSARAVKIDWAGGEWTFSPQWRWRVYRGRQGGSQFTPQTLAPRKIKPGSTNCVDYLGGLFFLLPGRIVWIDDYKITLRERKAIFYGTYSFLAT
eukprot:GFUD01043696.1.p1 GENE.GFUD01043696.1~~GFUD01043696.1.p1  ORF type:complete len:143 (+),score=17.51 GFUD01043696.1:64-492(+)